MIQRQPNPTELTSMDSYDQILCRFQKSKQKVPPLSPLSTQKLSFIPPKGGEKSSFGVVKGDF